MMALERLLGKLRQRGSGPTSVMGGLALMAVSFGNLLAISSPEIGECSAARGFSISLAIVALLGFFLSIWLNKRHMLGTRRHHPRFYVTAGFTIGLIGFFEVVLIVGIFGAILGLESHQFDYTVLKWGLLLGVYLLLVPTLFIGSAVLGDITEAQAATGLQVLGGIFTSSVVVAGILSFACDPDTLMLIEHVSP